MRKRACLCVYLFVCQCDLMSVSVFMSVCLYVLIAGVAAAAVLSMVMFTM